MHVFELGPKIFEMHVFARFCTFLHVFFDPKMSVISDDMVSWVMDFFNTVRPCDARFFGKEKKCAAQNRAVQGFHFINLFISSFFGPNSKTCTCEVCAA